MIDGSIEIEPGAVVSHDPERAQNLTVRDPKLHDLHDLHYLLRNWVRARDDGSVISEEVGDVLKSVADSTRSVGDKQYVVVEDEAGKPVGIMGMKLPDETMLPYATTERPIEIVNAYVDPAEVGKGIGSVLLEALEQKAREQGYQEVLVNSGPRYRHSGWGFWTARYGEPVAVAEGLYGNRADAKVWRRSLVLAE